MDKTLMVSGGMAAALAANAANLGRTELEKKLEALALAPVPAVLAPGAMCYAPMPPLKEAAFVCSACGEKTLHTASQGTPLFTVLQADACRRLAQALKEKGLDCRLDDTAFCSKCGQGAKEKQFVLVLRLAGEPERRIPLQGPDDLKLLLELLTDKRVHDNGPGGEKPLKEQLPRLRQLLGLGTAPEKSPAR